MDGLIYQNAAPIKRQSSAPSRIAVVLPRPKPFHTGIDKQQAAHCPFVNDLLEPYDVRGEAILKDHSQFHSCSLAFGNQRIRTRGTDIDRLFDEHVQSLTSASYIV